MKSRQYDKPLYEEGRVQSNDLVAVWLDRLDVDAHRACTTGRDLVPKGMIEVVQ
jgi:hypothetical protein